MNDHPVLIFGAGGFGREVAASLRANVVRCMMIADASEDRAVTVLEPGSTLFCERFALIAVGDPKARRRIAERPEFARAQFVTHVSRDARLVDPKSVALLPGAIVCAGSVITCNVIVGRHVHINLKCTVGHDAIIGDYVTLSPGVHVSGSVTIGEGVFVGTGAVLLPKVSIGAGAVIAAGAVVTRDVPAGAMVAGVPAVIKHARQS